MLPNVAGRALPEPVHLDMQHDLHSMSKHSMSETPATGRRIFCKGYILSQMVFTCYKSFERVQILICEKLVRAVFKSSDGKYWNNITTGTIRRRICSTIIYCSIIVFFLISIQCLSHWFNLFWWCSFFHRKTW